MFLPLRWLAQPTLCCSIPPPRRGGFRGPNDLSQALGVPGHYDDPRYVAAIEKVSSVARDSGKAAGIMLRTVDQIPDLSDLGYSVFTTSDRSLLLQSAGAWRKSLKGAR